MRYFGAFESCTLFLYKWKTSVTQIVRYTPTHTHAHGEMEASVPLLPFHLGRRIQLHAGSPRGASERVGRREETRGTMWERDC